MGIYLNGKMVSTAMPLSSGNTDPSLIDSKITAHNSDPNAHSAMLKTAINNALAQAKESGEFKGDKGDKGDTGPQGPTGVTGTRGSTWSVSNNGAPSMDGSELKGDMLLDKSNGDVYTANVETMDWEKVMNIKGPKGDKGDKGDGSTGSSVTVNGINNGEVKTTKIYDFIFDSGQITTTSNPINIYESLNAGYDVKARLTLPQMSYPPFILSCVAAFLNDGVYIVSFSTTGAMKNGSIIHFTILWAGESWNLFTYNSSDDGVSASNISSALGYTPFNPANIDSALSSTSTNPVQNKVINTALAGKLSTTGGTLTGNLTGKYLTGTWLQTTAVTEASSVSKIAVIDASGWIYSRSLSNLKTDLGIPTKTSQLTNDSGFLTSHQSLSGYAKETWVTQQIQAAIDATWEASY